MKFLSGISLAALLIAGAVATPSFATSLSPGGIVVPATTGVSGAGFNILGNTGVIAFNFGGNTGNVQEIVGNNYAGNPFGAGDITFLYQLNVTGGNILNLTSGSWNVPGISIDVLQYNGFLDSPFTGPFTPAANASLTSNGVTLGFGFTQPDGLEPGMTSYILIVNTNLPVYEPGVYSLQDDQTENFDGYVPGVVPEPSSLALLGTGLLGAAGMARRRFFRK